ncbi:MAG TPA: hypothetical protein VFR00_12525, partial [Hyphomicrobiaceae bacterium]|nr:hypothetical protein [Hyphomicrobiaceae bacterium]
PRLTPALLATLLARGFAATARGDFSGHALAQLGAHRDFAGAPRQDEVAALLASDQFRAALGRIASRYDGGHLD